MGRKKKNEYPIFNTENGPMMMNPTIWVSTGEEYCPECHIKMVNIDHGYKCPTCGHDISYEESSNGDGFPSLEATYEQDYFNYYRSVLNSDKPDKCKKCVGPWPKCKSSCRISDKDD